MSKKFLFLILSAILLVGCQQDKKNTDKDNSSVDSTTTSVSSTTSTTADTSIQQLDNEDIAVAQKEFLKVLSLREELVVSFLQSVQSFDPTTFTPEKVKVIQGKMFQSSLEIQKKINNLKITNQEIKNYIEAQNKLITLGEKVYKAQSQIEKEHKAGKLSEASESLLKEIQAAQSQFVQQEVTLTEKLAQAGEANPIKELLQLKDIQNKEMIQLAASMQTLLSDNSSEVEKAQKTKDILIKINNNTVAELNKLTITTPEIEAYRKQLLELAKLKEESFKKVDQIKKGIYDKNLSPEIEQLIKKVQQEGLNVDKIRIDLIKKYAQ